MNEIERMVVRLEGDASSYESMIKEAETSIRGLSSTMNKSDKEITALAKKTVDELQKQRDQDMKASADALKKKDEENKKYWESARKYAIIGVAAVAAAMVGLTVATVSAVDHIMKLDTMSRRLNVSILELRGGALWAGTSIETIAVAIESIQTKLGLLRIGSEQVNREFNNLAAVAGVARSTLKDGDWVTTIETISKIQDPARRAAQAYRFLGGAAAETLREIDRGGPRAAINMAERFGLAVKGNDVENLRVVAALMRQLQALGSGVFNQILLGLAPIAAEVSDLLRVAGIDIRGIKDTVTNVGLAIGEWGAWVTAVISDVKLLDNAFKALGNLMDEMGLRFKASMLDALSDIARAVPWMGERMAKDLAERARVSRVRADSKRESAVADLGLVSGSVREDIENTPIMKSFREFEMRVRDRMKAPPEERRDQRNAGTNIDRLIKAMDTMVAGIQNPFDTFKTAVGEFREMQRLGLFEGRKQDEGAMAMKLFNDLKSGTGLGGQAQFAGAAEANSREAYSAINQFRAEQGRGNIQEQMRNLLDQARVQDRMKIALQQQMLAALNEIKDKPGMDL